MGSIGGRPREIILIETVFFKANLYGLIRATCHSNERQHKKDDCLSISYFRKPFHIPNPLCVSYLYVLYLASEKFFLFFLCINMIIKAVKSSYLIFE